MGLRSLGAWTCIAAIASAGGRGRAGAPPSVVSVMRRMIACLPLTFHKQMKGKVWVLDTETKGTGAQMVPLESVQKTPQPKEHLLDPRMRRQKAEPESDVPRAPRRFKLVDVSTRQVLADDADARMTLELLGRQRSSVDVNVHVWEPEEERWRLLTLAERQLLWERRPRGVGPSS